MNHVIWILSKNLYSDLTTSIHPKQNFNHPPNKVPNNVPNNVLHNIPNNVPKNIPKNIPKNVLRTSLKVSLRVSLRNFLKRLSPGCMLMDKDFWGGDIKHFTTKNKNVIECRNACMAEKSCKAYSMLKNNGVCYIKHGGHKPISNNGNIISGLKRCYLGKLT